jgi:hypothetical protein
MQAHSMPFWKTLLSIATLVFWLASPGTAAADDDVSKLRDEGIAAYNAGNFTRAKESFDAAFKLVPLHTLGVWGARTRVKLGQWLEADDHYQRVLKTPIKQGEPLAEQQAKADAAKEREELRHRMPRVRIRLEGAEGNEVQVQIDGVPVAPELLAVKKEGPFRRGKSLELDPGQHKIVGIIGDQRQETSVTIAEGETKDVTLRFANPDTLRQRKCRDQCRTSCKDDNSCYVECKRRCFTKG